MKGHALLVNIGIWKRAAINPIILKSYFRGGIGFFNFFYKMVIPANANGRKFFIYCNPKNSIVSG